MKKLLLLFSLSIITLAGFAAGNAEFNQGLAGSEEVIRNDIKDHIKKDRKEIKGKIKNALKDVKKGNDNADTILLVILSVLLPPLAVYLYFDAITTQFWIDLILTLLFWLPGIIYALIVIFA